MNLLLIGIRSKNSASSNVGPIYTPFPNRITTLSEIINDFETSSIVDISG